MFLRGDEPPLPVDQPSPPPYHFSWGLVVVWIALLVLVLSVWNSIKPTESDQLPEESRNDSYHGRHWKPKYRTSRIRLVTFFQWTLVSIVIAGFFGIMYLLEVRG